MRYAILGLALLLGCVAPETPLATPVPTAEPPAPLRVAINPATLYPDSVDEMLFNSPYAVLATLKAITPSTESRDGKYAATHELTFTVHEWLKGTGAAEIKVVVRARDPHTYVMQEVALDAAGAIVQDRNRTWDSRRAILFLMKETEEPYREMYGITATSSGNYVFPIWDSHHRPALFYTIDSLNRVWLPATTVAADATTFLTEVDPEEETITLAAVRTAKANLDSETKAGQGVEGFGLCLKRKLAREQTQREIPAAVPERTADIPSGTVPELNRDSWGAGAAEDYHNYWLSGDDASLFRTVQIDNDDNPRNGYSHGLAVDRPLPSGVYEVRYNWQHHQYIPCNYKPDDAYYAWTVTVEAPEGVTHETLFDPENRRQGTRVGQLNVSDQVKRILWFSDGTPRIEIETAAAQVDKVVEIIAIDGTLAHEFYTADYTTMDRTLTIPMASKPWSDGDKLMVRIREAPNRPPAFTQDSE